MPVRVQGQSEYNRQFQFGLDPHDPALPEFYKPPTQQKAILHKNGITHEPPLQHKKKAVPDVDHLPHKYMCLEPPLQRKKKPVQPRGSKPTALSQDEADEWQDGDEYVLLGSQKKFAPNIVYKAKPVNVSQEKRKVDKEEQVTTPMAPRPDPPPRVTVDTGAPGFSRKLDKQHENSQKHKRDTKQSSDKSVQQARETEKWEEEVRQKYREAYKQGHHEGQPKKDPTKHGSRQDHKTSDKPNRGDKLQVQNSDHLSSKKSPPKPQPSAKEPKSRDKHTSSKQTNTIQNGLAPEEKAPSDYALKYKVGIAPPRGQGPKRLSEYQRQFAWKQGVESSPLLDADQVVYKSSTQILPRKAKFSRTTEYRREFQPWQSLGEPINEQFSKTSTAPSKRKVQRSKSVEALSPDKRQPAGKEKVTSEVDPRLVLESLNPLRPYFPHGPYRNYSSEYAANFAPPQVYQYEKGAWKGANPPHLQTDQVKEKDTKSKDKPSRQKPAEERPKSSPSKASGENKSTGPANSWFMEVIELRKRAEEYKRRAQGTHFSRQHLVQLLAEQAELWDTASTSSVLSALSLEHPYVDRTAQYSGRKKSSAPKDQVNAPPAGKKTAWGDDREPVDESARSASIVTTFDTQSVQNDLSEAPTLVEDEPSDKASDSTVTPAGRIPTPKMPASGFRHHLDRTTPLRGGALLSSPPKNKTMSTFNGYRKPSRSVDSPPLPPSAESQEDAMQASPSARSESSQASKSVNKLVKPLYGMPTRDTHVLVDETASVDRPLITDYVDTPIKYAKHNRDRFPEVSVPSTIQEDTNDTRLSKFRSTGSIKKSKSSQNEVTLGDIPQKSAEDDILSVSMRSVASSCSLASEVLERARARRDEFWGPSGRA